MEPDVEQDLDWTLNQSKTVTDLKFCNFCFCSERNFSLIKDEMYCRARPGSDNAAVLLCFLTWFESKPASSLSPLQERVLLPLLSENWYEPKLFWG